MKTLAWTCLILGLSGSLLGCGGGGDEGPTPNPNGEGTGKQLEELPPTGDPERPAALPPDAGTPAQTPSAPGYATDIQPIWNRLCTSCHGTSNQGLDLLSPGSRERLLEKSRDCWKDGVRVRRRLVVPGNPEESVLWHKTGNVDLSCGREMPPNGKGGLVELDPEAFRTLQAWIRGGALE